MSIVAVFYTLGSVTYMYIPKRFEKRLIMMVCALLCFLGYLTCGPSQLL